MREIAILVGCCKLIPRTTAQVIEGVQSTGATVVLLRPIPLASFRLLADLTKGYRQNEGADSHDA